jgi:HAE1 family hydrophobic/amphiphilic exporter-1
LVEGRRDRRRARRAAKVPQTAEALNADGTPRHSAGEPEPDVRAAGVPTPDSSGGAHEAQPVQNLATGSALRGYTDQFEVLKFPRNRPVDPQA